MAKELVYTKVLSEDSSFQLVRTNPKLTGNVKLTTNGSDSLWLNAIPANLELAKDDYSKFPIDTTHSLAANIYQFFKRGETPSEIIFDATEKVDTTKTSKEYKDQFDFSYYFSGAKYFASNKYEERFSYFAPLYLKKDIPKYFVIFKIKDPMNHPVDDFKTKYEAGYESDEYLMDLFKNASIIKTFDLGPDSVIGKYIRDYKEAYNFPVSPLTVSYESNEYTTWNGIVIDSGVMGSKGELMYDQFVNSTPLKSFEENITKGYERNGVIFPNILNLEFIFNDDTSEDYEINRYFGAYVNAIELAKLEVDLERAYSERSTWPNNEPLKRLYYENEETILSQSNSDGVVFPYKNAGIYMSEFKDIFSDSEELYFNYISDNDGNLHIPKPSDPYEIDRTQIPISLDSLVSSGTTITATTNDAVDIPDKSLIFVDSSDSEYAGTFLTTRISAQSFTYEVSTAPVNPSANGLGYTESGTGKITLGDTVIDLANLFGPSKDIYLQDEGFGTTSKGYSYQAIKIKSNLAHGDEIRLYHPRGTRTDSNGKFDLLTAVIGYSECPNSGDAYIWNDIDNTVGYDVFYFNPTGYATEVAKAITTTLNGMLNRTFTAYAFNDHVFIKCNANGEFDQLHALSFTSPSANYSSVNLDGVEDNDLISNIIYFKGGSKPVGNRLVIDRKHLSKINAEFDNILVKTKTSWSRISKVASYVDLVTETNLGTTAGVTKALEEYNDKIVITLVEEDSPSINYTEFLMHKKFRPAFGLLSLFPIKDLDFDFYTSKYLNFPEVDFYKDYYIPEEAELLEPGKNYKVYGTGEIDVSGLGTVLAGTAFQVLFQASYTILSGNPIVSFDDDITSVGKESINGIIDQNEELINFQGFSILKDPANIIPDDGSDEYRLKNKYLNGLSSTEYDFYKENEAVDFSLRSKILPYITKWAIKDGKDSRSNPYRLNTEIVFGRNNFSPDHTDLSQNPDNFTHEWFYIESKFNYADFLESMQKNDYYFDNPLDETELLSDPDYFLNYFTYTPQFGTNSDGNPIDIGETQFRYSRIYKNKSGQFEAFFKGFKVLFKDVNRENEFGEDNKPISKQKTNRFSDYKFTCILKPVLEDWSNQSQQPVKYRFVEHKDFKFIVLIIEVAIGDMSQLANHWKTIADPTEPSSISSELLATLPEVSLTDPNYGGLFNPVLPYQTVYGDYRFDFETINGLDISNLNHTMLYAIKNKKYNVLLDNFSNVKLSSKLNIYNPLLSESLARIDSPYIENYPSFLTDEIINPTSTKIIGYRDVLNGQEYFIDQITGSTPNSYNPIDNSIDEAVTYPNLIFPDDIGIIIPNGVSPYVSYVQLLPLPPNFQTIIKNYYQFFVLLGGEQYYERLFSKLSFGQFKKYINQLNPIVEYESYELDSNGNTVSLASPKYYIELPDQGEIKKTSQVITLSDDDKPSQYSGNDIIGYVYEQAKLDNVLELNRYKGEFEPVFRDTLFTRSKYYFKYNDIENISLGNTRLNTNISSLLALTNFNHIKIADSKILTLESDEAYSPQYPKINEIAIGRSNYFLMGSNWDWGFHHKYSNKENSSPVSGAIRVEEDECFISKLVSLPEEIELEIFDLVTLGESETLDSVDLDEIEMVAKENTDSIEGFFNLNNIITNYFIDDGIENKFNDYLINDTNFIGTYDSIQEYVVDYIKVNLLKLYEVQEVEFYQLRDASISSTEEANPNTISFEFLTDADRFELGYSRIKTIGINKPDRLILRYTIQKNFDASARISPKIKIKFI